MQINPKNSSPSAGLPARLTGKAGEPVVGSQDSTAGSNESEISDLVGQLPIGRLVELLNSSSEVRAELVEKARKNLAVGDYLLPKAAEKTADAILGVPVADLNQSP